MNGWRKVLRWLASRPLDRVRANRERARLFLARTGIDPDHPGLLGEEVRRFYEKAALEPATIRFTELLEDEAGKLHARYRLVGGARGGGKTTLLRKMVNVDLFGPEFAAELERLEREEADRDDEDRES